MRARDDLKTCTFTVGPSSAELSNGLKNDKFVRTCCKRALVFTGTMRGVVDTLESLLVKHVVVR